MSKLIRIAVLDGQTPAKDLDAKLWTIKIWVKDRDNAGKILGTYVEQFPRHMLLSQASELARSNAHTWFEGHFGPGTCDCEDALSVSAREAA